MPIPSEEALLAAGCHIGHRNFKWNPKMKPFLYGTKKGVHIFDLTKTKEQLEKVCEELSKMSKEGKSILLVSTKPFSAPLLEEAGQATGQPIVTKKWIPGLLTNWKTISRRIKYYLGLQKDFRSGEVEKYTKKEQLKLRKKLTHLDNALAGVAGMTGLPDAVFVLDAVRDRVAVREANKINLPVYGICDSNADPDDFTIAIPANDDAIHSMKIILETVRDALGAAPAKKEEEKKESPAEATAS